MKQLLSIIVFCTTPLFGMQEASTSAAQPQQAFEDFLHTHLSADTYQDLTAQSKALAALLNQVPDAIKREDDVKVAQLEQSLTTQRAKFLQTVDSHVDTQKLMPYLVGCMPKEISAEVQKLEYELETDKEKHWINLQLGKPYKEFQQAMADITTHVKQTDSLQELADLPTIGSAYKKYLNDVRKIYPQFANATARTAIPHTVSSLYDVITLCKHPVIWEQYQATLAAFNYPISPDQQERNSLVALLKTYLLMVESFFDHKDRARAQATYPRPLDADSDNENN